METVLKAIADWIKGILTAGIMSNLSGLFDDVNTQVGNIAQQVGTKPSSFEPRVFAMIEALSRNVVLPIAGIILTFIACYELIEMITQHNNMAQFEPALIMRWIFKTAATPTTSPSAVSLTAGGWQRPLRAARSSVGASRRPSPSPAGCPSPTRTPPPRSWLKISHRWPWKTGGSLTRLPPPNGC
jgi:hypothetical protein